MQIVYKKIADLKKYEKNNKKHPERQLVKIVASIKEYGFKNPVLIDKNNVIISGHGRTLAAERLGMEEVPCIDCSDLNAKQVKALRLMDNKSAELAEWDFDNIKAELEELKLQEFDIELTGFDMLDFEEEEEVKEDEFDVEEQLKKPVMSKLGDIWLLGRHRLMCGDSTDKATVEKLMNGKKADMILTDPPYNVDYKGGNGLKIQNDNMSDSNFRLFLRDAFASGNEVLKAGGVFYIWHADIEGYNFRGACHDIGWKVRQCLIWNKNSLVMGRQDYHWKHEPCLYGWKDGAGHLWHSDRTQTTVHEDSKSLNIKKLTKEELVLLTMQLMEERKTAHTTVIDCPKPSVSEEHPTMKPIKLFDYQIKNNTEQKDIVLDSFLGSGTTIMACQQNGRIGYGLELGENYCDVIVNRFKEFVGETKDIKCIRNGETFTYEEIFRETI